jgi:LytS/YehU family sensor histidine kinase
MIVGSLELSDLSTSTIRRFIQDQVLNHQKQKGEKVDLRFSQLVYSIVPAAKDYFKALRSTGWVEA